MLTTLWVAGLLVVISTTLIWGGQGAYIVARNYAESARVSAVGDAVLNYGIFELFARNKRGELRTDGKEREVGLLGRSVNISIQDELGLIDLNQANTAVLIGLVRSAGQAAEMSQAIVDKIVVWRSESESEWRPAEERAIGQGLKPYKPRHGAFQSVDELRLVAGVTDNLFQKLVPSITVYSGYQFVDPQVAPRSVLLALPNIDIATADALLAARDQANANSGNVTLDESQLQGRAYTIRATFVESGTKISPEATIRITGDAKEPFWVLRWKSK
jgi:general secretion pathway protein K